MLSASAAAQPELGFVEACTVQILNQTVHVKADGSWILPNIPSNGGQVRARLNCESALGTRTGQSDFFVIKRNRMNAIRRIPFGDIDTGPTMIALTSALDTLTDVDQTMALDVIGSYSGGADEDISAADTGTSYLSTNSEVLSVDEAGLVTAHKSGAVVVTAWNQGVSAAVWLAVKIGDDTDQDGIPDDYENANGMDATNPLDALADTDADGLNNLEEFENGTSPFDADTDKDGLSDGEEVNDGSDGWQTSPLLADTDGDGLPDPAEIASGTDPTDAQSFDFDEALVGIEILPGKIDLFYNPIFGEASGKITVRGLLLDGTTINLTNHPLVGYGSGNISIASFGVVPGEVFAGVAGKTFVTATLAGWSTQVPVTVKVFTPQPLAAKKLPCAARDVAVTSTAAFVSCNSSDVLSIGIGTPTVPAVQDVVSLGGTLYMIDAAGDQAWVAAGNTGLVGLQRAANGQLTTLSVTDLGATVRGVALVGAVVVAVTSQGTLATYDISAPKEPKLLATLALSVGAIDLAVDGSRAVVLTTAGTVLGVDLTDPADPILGAIAAGVSGGRRIALDGTTAHLAVGNAGLRTIDVTDPLKPISLAKLGPPAFMLNDVAAGSLVVLGADYYRVNSVPIVQVAVPADPIFAGVVEFSGYNDANGVAIDVGPELVAMIGAKGSGYYLFLGQYATVKDTFGIPPVCVIKAPQNAAEITTGTKVVVEVTALDDVLVSNVTVSLDGLGVGTTSLPPYAVTVPLPADLAIHQITAFATDIGGNIGECSPVGVQLVVDPLTTVVGTVVDESNLPISGAQVVITSDFLVAETEADGSFVIPGATTANGVSILASGDVGITTYTDSFGPFEAVPKGTTDVGQLKLVTPAGQKIMAGLVAIAVPYQVTKATESGELAMGAVVAVAVPYRLTAGANPGPEASMGALVAAAAVPFVVRDSSYYPGQPQGAVAASAVGYTFRPWVLGVAPEALSAQAGVANVTLSGFGFGDVVSVELWFAGQKNTLIQPNGPLTISADGSQIEVSLTVDPTAPAGVWTVVLLTTNDNSPTLAGPGNTVEVVE